LFSMKANTKNLTIFSEDYFFNDARQNQNI